MPVNKPHLEFHRVDMSSGWSTPPGYPAGIDQKILAGSLDEQRRRGSRTRLLRFAPGVFTTEPFVHQYWEEVYLVEGDLTVGSDAEGKGGENFPHGTYACRPPGAVHGPFSRTAAVSSTRSIISPNNGGLRLACHRFARKMSRERLQKIQLWGRLLPEPGRRSPAFNR